MVDAARLNELADHCEKATGPDRELDAAIALACPPKDKSRHVTIRGYTASIDAATTLVPEGAHSGHDTRDGTAMVWCERRQFIGQAATPALALCAAALRARAAQ